MKKAHLSFRNVIAQPHEIGGDSEEVVFAKLLGGI